MVVIRIESHFTLENREERTLSPKWRPISWVKLDIYETTAARKKHFMGHTWFGHRPASAHLEHLAEQTQTFRRGAPSEAVPRAGPAPARHCDSANAGEGISKTLAHQPPICK